MNEDITDLVLEYREAIRTLWNSHAKNLDGEHRFGKIAEDYFCFSVLFQSESRVSPDTDPKSHYYKHVKVVPNLDLSTLCRTPNYTAFCISS